MPASQLLRQPGVRLDQLIAEERVVARIDPAEPHIDVASAETTVKYAGYLRRQESEIERARKDERRRIPADFPFERVPGLSKEIVQRLTQVRPDTLGHALRIPGVTPAAVAVLSAYVRRLQLTSERSDGFLSSEGFRELLEQRADRASLSLDPALVTKLEVYFGLLARWNRRINLTSLPLEHFAGPTLDRLFVEPLLAARIFPGISRCGSILVLVAGRPRFLCSSCILPSG